MIPLFVELCAGTAALSIRLHGGKNARPPVSRMGNKQGYASAILRCLGLRSGSGAARYLWCEPDDGCRLLLTSYTDAELKSKAAEIIRGWRDENPRKLWDRLRAEGPVKAPPADPREVARWIRLVTANRLINVGPDFKNTGQGGSTHGGESFCTTIPELLDALDRVPDHLPASILPDARAVDPREVARWCLDTAWSIGNAAGNGGFKNPYGGLSGSGRVDCLTINGMQERFDALPTIPASILPDARAVEPPQLPPGSVVIIDPPYLGHLGEHPTTGYAHSLPRADVLTMARRWSDAGAWVVICECAPIVELEGWHVVEITGERIGQKRVFSKQQREYLTMSRPPAWRPAVQNTLF
jgi:hypothetical protein